MPELFGVEYNKLDIDEYNYVGMTLYGHIDRNALHDLAYNAAKLYIYHGIQHISFNAIERIPELETSLRKNSKYSYGCSSIKLFRIMGDEFVNNVMKAKINNVIEYFGKSKPNTKSARNV